MRLLDLGCGSGAAAEYLASRRNIEIVCVTNSSVQADICRRKFAKLGKRGQVIVADFDNLDLPSENFDAIYALESIGYTKDLDAWLAQCWRMLKPGGRLLIRSPGSLDHCRRKEDYLSVTAFFENWRYNFVGANLLVYKMRRLVFKPIRYRRLPFWAWGLTWNFIQHMLLWKYQLKMRTFVELERIIWRTSKVFVFGRATVRKRAAPSYFAGLVPSCHGAFTLGLLAAESKQSCFPQGGAHGDTAQDYVQRVESASLADVAKELAPLTFAVTMRQAFRCKGRFDGRGLNSADRLHGSGGNGDVAGGGARSRRPIQRVPLHDWFEHLASGKGLRGPLPMAMWSKMQTGRRRRTASTIASAYRFQRAAPSRIGSTFLTKP
jgi:SAM-dependent methyltransferase